MDGFKVAIVEDWNKIDDNTIKSLVKSIKDKMFSHFRDSLCHL